MASGVPQGPRLLYGFKRLTRFDKGLGAQLPDAYKKFWREWKLTIPTAVHYIPKEGEWERDEVTNAIKPVQNIPLPLIDPPEANEGIWGGEAVIKGFQKRSPLKRRVPRFWVPDLRRTVIHSEVLQEYMSVVVTDRTMDQIHESFGFDHYLLKNPACDLRSTLALKLKRKVLLELLHGCPSSASKPSEQERILNEYSRYLSSYTPEEIDWYGFTYPQAIRKLQAELRAKNKEIPHKFEYRGLLIQKLKQAGITAEGTQPASSSASCDNDNITCKDTDVEAFSKLETSSGKWLKKINPFGKKHET